MEDAPESDCGTLQIPSSGQKPPSRPHLLPELVLVVMEHLAASGLKRTLLRLMLADRACYALGTPPLLRYLRLRETFRGFEAFAGALSSPGKFAHVRRLTLSRHPCHALLSILSRTTGLEAVSLEAPCATSAAVLGLLSLSPTLRDLRCAMPDFAPPGTTTVFLYPELSSKLRSVRVPAWARDAFLLQPPPNLLDAEIRDASGCDRAALARIRDLGRLETLCLWHAPTSALSACLPPKLRRLVIVNPLPDLVLTESGMAAAEIMGHGLEVDFALRSYSSFLEWGRNSDERAFWALFPRVSITGSYGGLLGNPTAAFE